MNEVTNMNFTHQMEIFNPNDYNTKVVIIGAGSTGSHLAFILSKMGINDMMVIDDDKIEITNIPHQHYRISDIGKFKVDALKEIIKDFSNIDIKTDKNRIDENSNINLGINTIFISCVDTLKSRKILLEHLEDSHNIFIDTRFGSEGYSINIIDLFNDNEVENYMNNLTNQPVKKTPCGEKGIIYSIDSLSSETANIVKKIIMGEKYPKVFRREMKTYNIISK